jgi:hypothetical protein
MTFQSSSFHLNLRRLKINRRLSHRRRRRRCHFCFSDRNLNLMCVIDMVGFGRKKKERMRCCGFDETTQRRSDTGHCHDWSISYLLFFYYYYLFLAKKKQKCQKNVFFFLFFLSLIQFKKKKKLHYKI